jgi:hypothetical protein
MSTNDHNKTSKSSTPNKAPDGKSDLPTTLPDFPGPTTTPPPASADSAPATTSE